MENYLIQSIQIIFSLVNLQCSKVGHTVFMYVLQVTLYIFAFNQTTFNAMISMIVKHEYDF